MTPETVRPSRKVWQLYVGLVLILSLFVAQTLVFGRETPRERERSRALKWYRDALYSTKLAYNSDLILRPDYTGKAKNLTNLFLNENNANKAMVAARWRNLATSRTGRAAEWRRLGITLYLFHLPGGLEALSHVTDSFPPTEPITLKTPGTLKTHDSGGGADLFGQDPVSISPARELAMWEGIYGPHPITAADAGQYRARLAQLHLGWFEDVAAAQLYMKVHDIDLARAAAGAAGRSAGLLIELKSLEVAVNMVGGIGLVLILVIGFAGKVQRTPAWFPITLPRLRAPYIAVARRNADLSDPSQACSGGSQAQTPQVAADGIGSRNRPGGPFPHTALLAVFIRYLLSTEVISLLAGIVLYPVRSQIVHQFISRIILYIPIFMLPLLALRRRVRFDPHTGARIGWRNLLANIGFRTRNPVADIGAGALGYLLVIPAALVASLVSHWLFARYHTPQNPAVLEMQVAQGGLGRFLVFFVAVVRAPLVEETFFRGILYSAFRSQLGVWRGAMLSSAIFALVHPLPGDFLPIWVTGMGLALVYEWRQSLLPGMILHGLFNGIITLTIFAEFAR